MTEGVVLLGDSHAIAIGNGIRRQCNDLALYGNQLPMGRGWIQNFHTGGHPLQFSVPEAQKKLESFVKPAGFSAENILDINLPMIFSLTAIESLRYHPGWNDHSPFDLPRRQFISHQAFEEMVCDHYKHVLHFFRLLAEAGKTVVNVLSPGPRANDSRRGELQMLISEVLKREHATLGIPLVDVASATCDQNGVLLERYWVANEKDIIHANHLWGDEVAKASFELLGLP